MTARIACRLPTDDANVNGFVAGRNIGEAQERGARFNTAWAVTEARGREKHKHRKQTSAHPMKNRAHRTKNRTRMISEETRGARFNSAWTVTEARGRDNRPRRKKSKARGKKNTARGAESWSRGTKK
jgi:hypothetical protein